MNVTWKRALPIVIHALKSYNLTATAAWLHEPHATMVELVPGWQDQQYAVRSRWSAVLIANQPPTSVMTDHGGLGGWIPALWHVLESEYVGCLIRLSLYQGHGCPEGSNVAHLLIST